MFISLIFILEMIVSRFEVPAEIINSPEPIKDEEWNRALTKTQDLYEAEKKTEDLLVAQIDKRQS